MNIIHFPDLGEDIRASLQGKRWLVLRADDLPHATAALAFSELEDVLVAVDHRHRPIQDGLWMRAVHLLLVDETNDAEALQRSTGITRVTKAQGEVEQHLW
jgi:UDP-3-O-acyl-N-acetylglucosamine deacetylase